MPGFVSYWGCKDVVSWTLRVVRRHICKGIVLRQDCEINIQICLGSRVPNRESSREESRVQNDFTKMVTELSLNEEEDFDM